MKRILLLAITSCTFLTINAQEPLSEYDLNKPIGWAMVDGSITGGEGGEEVVVTTEDEFDAAINKKNPQTSERDVPMIIYLKGDIEFTKMHTLHVKNKTILGLPGSRIFSKDRTKKNSGILKFSSGSGANSENIILRNVTIEGAGAYDVDGDDALLFQGVPRVWVDHCDLRDGVDSTFDCNHESDYISVTWTRMRYLKDPLAGGSGGASDHRFCCTWGSSDKATESIGKLNTTFANCWWDEGVMERAPRVRFGKVHVVNCYYTNVGNNYSIGYGYLCNIYAEKCWFADGVTPIKDYTDAKHGYADYNLQMVDCHNIADKKQNVGNIEYFSPSDYYEYNGFDKELVPTIVGNEQTGAGANLMVEVGKGVTGYANGVAPTGITKTTGSSTCILSTAYYTPSGNRLNKPQKGLNIIKQEMGDGSTHTTKIMVR